MKHQPMISEAKEKDKTWVVQQALEALKLTNLLECFEKLMKTQETKT